MKMMLLNNYNSDSNNRNADNLMKILMIEKMCKSILDELTNLKESFVKTETTVSE